MTRNRLVLFASLCLAFASATAEAGRPRIQTLDSDALLLPYVEQDNLYTLTLLRDADGKLLLLDQSEATPVRVTPLGFTFPSGTTWGSYTATPDGHVWAAFSMAQGIRVYDLGDLEQPGPLAPTLLQAEPAVAGFVPRDTRLGIIAILIGLLTQPTPAISLTSITDGTSNTMMFAWDGHHFAGVVQNADGTWSWNKPQ